MRTIHLELPDDVAATLLATPDGLARARALLVAAFSPSPGEGDDLPSDWYACLAADVRAAYDAQIDASLNDADAGRTHPLVEGLARVRARHRPATDTA